MTVRLFAAALFAATLGGCASHVAQAPSPSPSAETAPQAPVAPAPTQDLATVTDNVASSILAIQEIANARATPHVVLAPIVNNTGYPVDKELLLTRMRVLLNVKAMNKIRFLDRTMMAALSDERLQAQAPGSPGPAQGPDYNLACQLDGPTIPSLENPGDHVLCSFHLTDARTNAVIWQDSYEIRRDGLDSSAFW